MNQMKKLTSCILAVLIISFFCANSQQLLSQPGRILVNSASASQQPEIQIVETSAQFIRYHIAIPAVDTSHLYINQEKFNQFFIEGFSLVAEPGKPALPVLGQMIAVPSGATISVKIIDAQVREIEGVYLAPAPFPLPEDKRRDHPQYTIDRAIYQADQFYPAEIGWTEPVKIIRGLPVTLLWISPVQFNPVQKKVRIYTSFTLEVHFSNGAGASIPQHHRSSHYDNIFNRIIPNWQAIQSDATAAGEVNDQFFWTGCDYLIITHKTFAAAADSLAQWRKHGGLETRIEFVEDIGTSADAIRAYIQNAYDNWNPAPTFVLLLGDAEFVPTNYFTDHPATDNGKVGTDLYYATVDGNDYFPDVVLGRISVDTALEAMSFIRKVINYERNPVADPQFYKTATVAAYFQDNDDPDTQNINERDGYEDRRFVLTSEEIRDFLLTQQYQVDRIYTAKPAVNPQYYSRMGFANGEPLQAELLRANGFQWDGNANHVIQAIQQGTFLVSHRDHGNRSGWGDPEFRNQHVKSLANENKLPVVFSTNCGTGWFDNETDDATCNTANSSESFVEYWLRNLQGGAIGVFGSSRISYSGYNDELAKGFIDAIWPSFLDFRISTDNMPIHHLGAVLDYGKFYMATKYSGTTIRKVEFEVFHYFGDPATTIWTSYPKNFVFDAPDSCFLNQTSLLVNVFEANATVTLLQNNNIVATTRSDANGNAFLMFSPISSASPITISVNKPNFKPFIAHIPVFPPKQFSIVCESKEIIDQDYNNQINIGETVIWKIGIRNAGKENVQGIELSLECSDAFIEILNQKAMIDNLQSNDQTTTSALSFKVDKSCPAGRQVQMSLKISAPPDQSIAVPLDFIVSQGKAKIELDPNIIAARVGAIHDSVTMTIKIENHGFGRLDFAMKDRAKEFIAIGNSGEPWWADSPLGAGNVYSFSEQQSLSRFGCYMKIESPMTLHFSVYEGQNFTGSYAKIGQSSFAVSQQTECFIWSGPLNIEMQPDRYYFLGVSWEGGDAKISRTVEIPPFDIPIGKALTGSMNLQGNPPADSAKQIFTRTITFAQQLELGQGDWLKGLPVTAELLPTEAIDIPLKLVATNADTTFFTNILIASNDAMNDSLLVPAYFMVGESDVSLVCQVSKIDDQFGNNDGKMNSGERILLPVAIKNIGVGVASNVTAALRSKSSAISLVDSLKTIASVAAGEEVPASAFELRVSPYVIGEQVARFQIDLIVNGNFHRTFESSYPVLEGKPIIEIATDSLTASISELEDSTFSHIEIKNSGFGRLNYKVENPVQQTVSIGMPTENWWLPLKDGVGNIYYPLQAAHVLAVRCYFQVDSAASIYFYIFEGDSMKGNYRSIASSKINVEQPGAGWYRSEIMECDLVPEKYYYIGASWLGTAKILRAKESTPFDVWNGRVLNGVFNLGGAPPKDQLRIEKFGSLSIAQQIITGEGEWLDIASATGTIFPAESAFIPVKFCATAAETTFTASLKIASNDPKRSLLHLPASLTVTAIATSVRKEHDIPPRTIELAQNYPNPFNPTTEIRYGISQMGHVELSIYNILGQRVKQLVTNVQTPGHYTITWNGKDQSENQVSSGVYLMVLHAEGKKISRKILLMK